MKNRTVLHKFRSRLIGQGIVKAFLCGLTVACGALLIAASVSWLVGLKSVWGTILCVSAFILSLLIAIPLFFYKKFLPSLKETARKVDALGLEERVLTMTELEGNESYIAKRQREDTEKSLKTVNEKMLQLAVSIPLIVVLAVCFVLGSGMTAVYALSETGHIHKASEIITPILEKDPVYYEVNFEIEGEGEIEGDIVQLIQEGKDSEAVMATPMDGWTFVAWSDENTDPYRVETNIHSNITVIAIFMEIDEGDGDSEPSDEPSDGEPNGEPSDNEDGSGSADPSDDPGNGAGGKYEEINQIINNETYYGDEFDQAYEDALKQMEEDGNLSEEEKAFILNYFNTIKAGSKAQNS